VVLRSTAGLRPHLALKVTYAFPFDSSSATVAPGVTLGAHASVFSPRLTGGVQVVRSGWFHLDAGVGGGFDVLNVAPRSDKLASLEQPTTKVDPVLTALLTAHAQLASGVVLLLSAAADVDLASRHYVGQSGATTDEVLSTWRVRPMILAGVGFTALGDEPASPTASR
jgi:hypothetical protein